MNFGRKILHDGLPPEQWQRLRTRQTGGRSPNDWGTGRLALTDDLPVRDWFSLRDADVRGLLGGGDARPARAVAPKAPPPNQVDEVVSTAPRPVPGARPRPPAPNGPLRGRPGTAAIVAGALNTIASGPNTSAPIKLKEHGVSVIGTLRRGDGRDIRASGKVSGLFPVGLEGTLDPPTGRAELSASGLKGKDVSIPSRVRIYTTPTGELDLELPGPVGIGPFKWDKGTYVIGTPDPPRRR